MVGGGSNYAGGGWPLFLLEHADCDHWCRSLFRPQRPPHGRNPICRKIPSSGDITGGGRPVYEPGGRTTHVAEVVVVAQKKKEETRRLTVSPFHFPFQKQFSCASERSNKISLAGLFGVNNPETHPVLNAALGNTFSGVVDTVSDFAQADAGAIVTDVAVGRTYAGLPGAKTLAQKGLAGMGTERFLGSVYRVGGAGTEAATDAVVSNVLLVKVGFDSVVFAGALTTGFL